MSNRYISFKSSSCVVLGIFIILLLFVTMIVFNYWSSSMGIKNSSQQHAMMKASLLSPVKKAELFSSLNGSAFVYLALGAQANQLNCQASIESLVKYAGWNGHIYMITDREECYQTEKIVTNAGMNPAMFHLIKTSEHFGDGGVDILHPIVGTRKKRFDSFKMKTRIFDFITDPSIQTIAYVDCDIIFGIEGCAERFLSASGPSWTGSQIRVTRITTGHTGEIEKIHCGSMVLHREHSNDLLRIWRAQLDKEVDDGDNDAYLTAYHMVEKEIEKLLLERKDSNKVHNPINFSGRISSNDTSSSYSKKARLINPNITTTSSQKRNNIRSRNNPNITTGNSNNIRYSEEKNTNSTTLPSLQKGRRLSGDPAIYLYPLDYTVGNVTMDRSAEEGEYYTKYSSSASRRLRRLDAMERTHVSMIKAILVERLKNGKYKNLNPLLPAQIKMVEGGNLNYRPNWFEWFANISHTDIYCMNHISKARCNSFGRENIQKKLVNRFELHTYEGKYLFCTHPLLQPLLYGWFPFGYLPTCPKMEMLL